MKCILFAYQMPKGTTLINQCLTVRLRLLWFQWLWRLSFNIDNIKDKDFLKNTQFISLSYFLQRSLRIVCRILQVEIFYHWGRYHYFEIYVPQEQCSFNLEYAEISRSVQTIKYIICACILCENRKSKKKPVFHFFLHSC